MISVTFTVTNQEAWAQPTLADEASTAISLVSELPELPGQQGPSIQSQCSVRRAIP